MTRGDDASMARSEHGQAHFVALLSREKINEAILNRLVQKATERRIQLIKTQLSEGGITNANSNLS